MNCDQVLDMLEQYGRGELSHQEREIAAHLKECSRCAEAYQEIKAVGEDLMQIGHRIELKPKERDAIRYMFTNHKETRSTFSRMLQYGSWVALLALFAFAGSIFMSPALAAKYLPDFPLVKQMLTLKEENRDLKDKLEVYLQKDNGEDEVVELTDQEKYQVQNTVLSFVKAQYAGNLERMMSLASTEFQEMLADDPAGMAPVFDDSTSLQYIIITNTVKTPEGKYMSFVRLEDSRTDSQYQENFYLERVGEQFLITMVEMDA